MSYSLSLKVVIVLVLAAASGSLGGVAYYYQIRAASLDSQVSTLNSNASSLNDQIATLKTEIANLTAQISWLQVTNSQLNQTYLQIQSLEAQLTAANTQLQSLETQLSNEITKVQSLESSFNTQLNTLNAQLAQAQAEIVQLQTQISQLQTQLQQSTGLCLSGKTIPIGELLDLTDGLSAQGIRARDGSLLAINDINHLLSSVGCCSLKFAVSVSDYALDNSRALTELQAFAAAGVQVVVGPLNSGAAYNLLTYANSNHIVLISPSSTSIALAIPNDYLFRTAPNDKWQGMADARIIQSEGATKLIIVQRHDSYGDSLANATGADFNYLLTANTGTIDRAGCISYDTVCIIPYAATITDFTNVISAVYSAFAALNSTAVNKVAIDAVSFEEFSQMIYQISQQHPSLLNGHLPGTGAGPTSVWTGTDGEAQDTIISGNVTSGPIISRIRLPSTVYAFLNNTKTEQLYSAFATAYPGNVCDFYCTGAYDDVWLAALATLQVGLYNGTRIQAAILTVADNYYGVTGWTQLEASGDRVATIYQIWKVVTPSGGTPTWVYGGYWDATTNPVVGFNPY
jgi:branched-chain amino acid transport system substrate-binding protein